MKSKKIVLMLSMIMTVAVYVMLGAFAFATSSDPADSEEMSLEGSWKVLVYVSNNQPTLIESEYMVITGQTVTDYRNQLDTPYVESEYTLENSPRGDGQISLKSLDRTYVYDFCSPDLVNFYENQDTFMTLCRVSDDLTLSAPEHVLVGTWNVCYRSGLNQIGTEVLAFDETSLNDYRNGSDTPTISVPYYWNEQNQVVVEKMGKVYDYVPLTREHICLIETDTGSVWELAVAE